MLELINAEEYTGIIKALYPNGEYELLKDYFTNEWDIVGCSGYEVGITSEKQLINFCLKNTNIDKFKVFKDFLNERLDFMCDYKNYEY